MLSSDGEIVVGAEQNDPSEYTPSPHAVKETGGGILLLRSVEIERPNHRFATAALVEDESLLHLPK